MAVFCIRLLWCCCRVLDCTGCIEKMVNNVKERGKPMDQLKKMIDIWLDAKKKVVVLIRTSKQCEERLRIVEQEVE